MPFATFLAFRFFFFSFFLLVTKPLSCGNQGWNCGFGLCIPKSYRCDGVPHCPNFSDEQNCFDCKEFRCGDGSCIPYWKTCNGVADCRDSSDENLPNCKCYFSK